MQNPITKFFYNERGQRIKKESYSSSGALQGTTYYILDLSGNAMAEYNQPNTSSQTITQTELPIYGASRLGVYYRGNQSMSYQLTDHLGNVRAVVTKPTIGATSMTSYADYYPFGEQLPNRNSMSAYRYAFQGQELDTELGMEAFQLRLWDGRIGRWLSPDPYGQYASPYLGMGNNPVSMIDPDGGFTEGSGDPPGFFGRLFASIGNWFTPEPPINMGTLKEVVVYRKPKSVESSRTITPFRVGVEWLSGNGARHRDFTNGDLFTEMLRQHSHIANARNTIKDNIANGGVLKGSEPYELDGIQGVGKYLKDYSTLLTGGLTGNLAVTYLGSYTLQWQVHNINSRNGTATVHFTVENSSTMQSASRPPVLGYLPLWQKTVGKSINEQFSTGWGSKTSQTFNWNETLNLRR